VPRSALEVELGELGLDLSASARSKLAVYVRELEHWSRVVNLTALRGRELLRRLVVEPIWIGRQLQISGTAADVGSGNGSPAIPLSLTAPLTGFHLIEARARRTAFLRHLVAQLDLKGVVRVHQGRLRDLVRNGFRVEAADWITLQAVNPTADLVDEMKAMAAPTTQVVWITSGRSAPVSTATVVSVPGSNTQAIVFRLDQF
jgi:16S rRNA (guanine(527)-N(7))-methyltransferase RsmG